MKEKTKNILISNLMLIVLLSCVNLNVSNAATADDVKNGKISLEEFLRTETSVDTSKLDMAQVINMYEELTEKYTNKEIADILEEHKEEFEKEGVNSNILSTGTNMLRTVDEKEIKKILKENINLEEIQEKLDNGYTSEEIVSEIVNEMTLKDKLSLGSKLVLSSYIFKTIVYTILGMSIYSVIVRWFIYKKAGKHAWATLIPIYRDVVYYKISDLSPWVLLLMFLPIIGWGILLIINIASKFYLARGFGKGIGFGFGLLVLNPIFELILAFNSNIKYIGFSDE